MGMRVRMDVARFQEQLRAKAEELHAATRPAAQAGAQIIYDRARQIVAAELTSKKEHMFHGTHGVYGPYKPGNLHDSIYQVYSEDNSYKDRSVYHISWNFEKAPYGFMVELGTSRAPSHSFIGRSIVETRSQVLEAIKTRFIEEVQK